MKYVLITSARNEEAFISPEHWIPLSRRRSCPNAGSSLTTARSTAPAEIVEGYAQNISLDRPFVISRPKREGRNFAAKAEAVNGALEQMQDLEFDVLGNLDADTSFEPDYMEFLMQKFSADPKLGVAGTPFTQDGGYDSTQG